MDLPTRLEKCAELIISKGCALEEGQELYVSAPVQTVEFTRLVVKMAYECGAKHVTVNWYDDMTSRLTYDYAAPEVFETIPAWMAERNNSLARNGAAVLDILSVDPKAMHGVDQQKRVAHIRASHKAMKEFYDSIDFGRTHWCIVGAPSEQWARQVFPRLTPDLATKRLWKAVLDTARVDADPCAAWDAHRASFDERKAWLNSQHFDRLHYEASNGTDFTIGLLPKGHWEGGGQMGADGSYFFPNIPTEEIFTSPDRTRADGIVYSALPLVHNGSMVKDFWFEFKNGRVIDFGAQEGKDVLEGILTTDENSCRLGECSLVPFDSPIRNTGILFYETLYDENASCHLAFGKGFPDCYDGGYEMSNEELLEAGVNDSATHVDFMVGTEDMNITGIREDGVEVPIFTDGNWAE